MTVTAELHGRDLHITVEGIEAPFVIRPLPGRAGLQATDTFLAVAGHLGGAERAADMAAVMIMGVDGAVLDPDTGRWVPVPEDQQTNYARIGMELSQVEAESVLMPAFFWQTTLGLDGVKAYIEGGGGIAGTVKATGALAQRLAIFAPRTSPNSGSGAPTSAGSTPSTSTRPGGAKPGKQPHDRQPKKNKPRKG